MFSQGFLQQNKDSIEKNWAEKSDQFGSRPQGESIWKWRKIVLLILPDDKKFLNGSVDLQYCLLPTCKKFKRLNVGIAASK